MRTLYSIILLITFACCNSTLDEANVENSKTTAFASDTSHINVDTITINAQTFVQTYKEDRFQSLVSLSGDTAVTKKDYYHKLNFLDINYDGFDDLRIFVF